MSQAAAMDFRSSFTPSDASSPAVTGSTFSSANAEFNCSFVSVKGSKSLRPKPRLAKIRKQSKKLESFGPESSDRGNCSAASADNLNGSFVFGGDSGGSGSGSNDIGNFQFVFGANKGDSGPVNVESAFGANQSAEIGGTVPATDRSSSGPVSKFENLANLHSHLEQKASEKGLRQSGTFEFEKFGGVASVFTANESAQQPDNLGSNESMSSDTGFDANRSSSGLNFNLRNWEFGTNQNGSMANLSSVKEESGAGGGTPVPEMSENKAFVFGANLNSSSSYTNIKENKPFGNSEEFERRKADSEVESQKGSSNGTFVFRGNIGLGNISNEESGKFDKDMHNSESRNNAHIQDSYKFVFGSHSGLGTDFHKNNVGKLTEEFNSLGIGGDIGNKLSGNPHANIKNIFVFGSNPKNSCSSAECGSAAMNFNNQHKNLNSRVPDIGVEVGKPSAMPCSGKSCASGIDGKRASSLGVNTQNVMTESLDKNTEFVNCSEQINSLKFSAGIYGKENKPINLNEKSCDGNQFHFQHDNGVDRNAFSVPSFSPDTGTQLGGNAPIAPSLNKDERNDEARFTNLPFGIGGIFTEFKPSSSSEAFSFNVDLFSGLSNRDASESSKSSRVKKLRKKKASKQNLVKKQAEQQNNESPPCASPMDFSPYQETDSAPSADTKTTGGPKASEADDKCLGHSENNLKVDSGNHLNNQENFAFSSTPSSVDGLSVIRRQYKKKFKTKVCNRSNQIRQQKSGSASQVSQFPPLGHNDLSEVQSGATSAAQGNRVHLSNTDDAKQESPEYKACEKWRIRGNQAYKTGDLSKAEDFYSKGIKSVSSSNIPEHCIEPLLLCYSNRAATRMSLCRVREAINDCANAAALDPSFLKVKLRTANCYLLLGELQEAMLYFKSCLGSGIDVCLDRRITVGAADGLQKAEKVAENLHRCAELLQQKTSDAARSALEIITEALSISRYSEKLIEMKGECLCMLQKYDEAIKLCEQTLHFAEKNFASQNMGNMNDSIRLWRWRIMSKSYYHLGKLEASLNLIEKQEQVIFAKSKSNSQDSSISLGTTIRELIARKKAGNEAFQSGKFTEALDHYNAAISMGVESRPFAAICFCNRAAAHQSLGQIIDAIADCSVAMALDENYTKAASRRATLHEMIRDYEHAVSDLQRLILLLGNQSKEKAHQAGSQDRSNSSNAKELIKAGQCLSSIEDKAKSGIPLDLYVILGIKASDPESDIKKAYKKAALKHHPDKALQFLARSESAFDGQLRKEISEKVQKDADRIFKMIGEAYAVLSDSDKRSKYNYEEEIRAARKQSPRNYTRYKSSDSYDSPYERAQRSEFYSPPFRRGGGRRYGEESWRTYGSSHTDW